MGSYIAAHIRREKEKNVITLKVKDKKYKLKFGYKSFKNSGILKEVVAMQAKARGNKEENEQEKDAENQVELLEEVLELNSKLVLIALQKYHEEFRVDYENKEEMNILIDKVDDFMDEYMDEEDSMSIMDLFNELVDELFNSGFLSKKSEKLEAALETQDSTVVPMDHMKKEN